MKSTARMSRRRRRQLIRARTAHQRRPHARCGFRLLHGWARAGNGLEVAAEHGHRHVDRGQHATVPPIGSSPIVLTGCTTGEEATWVSAGPTRGFKQSAGAACWSRRAAGLRMAATDLDPRAAPRADESARKLPGGCRVHDGPGAVSGSARSSVRRSPHRPCPWRRERKLRVLASIRRLEARASAPGSRCFTPTRSTSTSTRRSAVTGCCAGTCVASPSRQARIQKFYPWPARSTSAQGACTPQVPTARIAALFMSVALAARQSLPTCTLHTPRPRQLRHPQGHAHAQDSRRLR